MELNAGIVEVGQKRLAVRKAEEALREAEARYAEPGIVTFETRIFNPEVFRYGGDDSLVVCHEALDKLGATDNVHVHVHPEPFVSFKGVEVARGSVFVECRDVDVWRSLIIDGLSIAEWSAKHARPGNILAVIDPEGGGK